MQEENKKLIREGYTLSRYIQILCTTNYLKNYSERYWSMFLSVQDELKPRFWRTWIIYINNLFNK